MSEETPPPAPPLTTWEKVKTGVTNFAKAAIDYLPRGLLMAGLTFGGSYLLGMYPIAGIGDFMGTATALGNNQLLTKLGGILLMGSVLSGGVGAYTAIQAATNERAGTAPDAQGEQLKRAQAQVPHRDIKKGDDMEALPPTGLPPRAVSAKGLS